MLNRNAQICYHVNIVDILLLKASQETGLLVLLFIIPDHGPISLFQHIQSHKT